MKKALLALLVVACAHAIIRAQIVPGRNFNVNPGIVDEFVGDKFLQRQVEPKIVCASNNPQLCLAIANDYRTVDQQADPSTGFGEGLATALKRSPGAKERLAALPDAWLGLYRSSNGARNWQNGLVPGSPIDTSTLGTSQPWSGLAAASDGALASDGVRFYGVGMFFNRGGFSMIGTFRMTAFNDESKFPIRWDAGYSRVIDQGFASGGRLTDLPTVFAEPSRTGAPCGNVYVAYTRFGGGGSSSIYLSRSSDCGANFSAPKKISGSIKSTQRAVMTIDPRNGTLYVFFRGFNPNIIAFSKSTDFGATWSSPIPVTSLSGPANLCVYDQPTVGVEASNPDAETARALAFASAQVDSSGKLHVVWTERVDATGRPPSGTACVATLQPKIVYTSSSSGGVTWSARRAIDQGLRCETIPGVLQAGGVDRSTPNGTSCPPNTTGRLSGPQIQPALAHNAGKLVLLYSEGRANPDNNEFLFNGYHSGRNTQMDIRAAQIDPLTGNVIGTTQVSQYAIDVNTNDIVEVDGATDPPDAKAYNRAYLPQYKGGTISFKGDHDDIVPLEPFVWGSGAHFATPQEVPAARFLGLWGGDNRESIFPIGGDLYNGDWTAYANPGTGQASTCNAGIRNSNNYVAYVGSPIEAFVHQSFKPPFEFLAPGSDPDRRRTWAVTVRNRGNTTRILKYALETTGNAGTVVFNQSGDVPVTVIGSDRDDPFCGPDEYPTCTAYRSILPQSSMTFTVFGQITNPAVAAPFKINVYEATLNQSGAVESEALAAIVRLNPVPNDPTTLAGKDISVKEHHGPSVEGPFVKTFKNPQPNPTQGNPTQGNPTQGNPTQGNPTQGNPTQGNAGFDDYTDYEFRVSAAADVNTLSQYSAFANIANATKVDDSHLVQMIITRRHLIPTLSAAPECAQMERVEDEVISVITVKDPKHFGVPTQGNPTQGNPTQGNPTQGNPTQGNPTQGNPTQGNNTFAISAPDVLDVASAARYRATALASAAARAVSSIASAIGPDGTLVGDPLTDQVIVNFRFFHCETTPCGPVTTSDGTPATFSGEGSDPADDAVPRACASHLCGPNEAASNLVGFVTIAGAGNNDNGAVTGAQTAGTGPPDLTIVSGPPVPSNGTVFEPGDVINFPAWTERNTGGTTANPSGATFFHGYYLSPDAEVTAADTLLVENSTNVVIPAQGQVTFSAGTAPIHPSTAPGNYFFGILADSHGDIAETDELNNFVSTAITIVANPAITTTSLADGTTGQAYSQQLQVSGGIAPFTWSIISGALPPGLTLNPSTGEISGIPNQVGNYAFTAKVTDSHNFSDTQALSIAVGSAPFAFANTDFVTTGVGGVRGGSGTATITLPPFLPGSTITRALLYWHGPTHSSDPTVNAAVTFNGQNVGGTNIGISYDNNWGFLNAQAYRADVTSLVSPSVLSTNYTLGNLRKFQSDQLVADINGASLIVFFDDGNPTNNRKVWVFDGNDSTGPGVGSWDQRWGGISYSPASEVASLLLHVGDGQVVAPNDDGAIVLNGTTITPTGDNFEGDSVPGPTGGTTSSGLWDIRSFGVSSTLKAGTNSLTSPHVNDFLSLVVALVVVQNTPPPVLTEDTGAVLLATGEMPRAGELKR